MIVRIKYSKNADGRYLSHLDLLRTFERVFRRAELPLAFSEGFNPHPKISYGSALAVGITSGGEYLDVELTEKIASAALLERLRTVCPPALSVLEAKELDRRTRSLTAEINMARYHVTVPLRRVMPQEELELVLRKIEAEPELVISRERKKGRTETDIRPGIYALKGSSHEDGISLEMDVQTGSEGNVRPEEIVELMKKFGNIDSEGYLRIHREGLYIRENAQIRSPL